jgi:mannose-6-phosphate isomerase
LRARRLPPSFREKIWGATDLAPFFPPTKEKIGEVWFASETAPSILTKFLFTSEKLSVQVHPDDAYGLKHENSPGKTEMWHILRAQPDARIALGFREPLTRDRLRDAALSGEIETLLRWIPVAPGETYFVPAGTVHAIGAGLALCEIQQHSDVTYRLYDYGRPRELHLERALAVADLGWHPGAALPGRAPEGQEHLACCPYFSAELHRFAQPAKLAPGLWVFLEGSGRIAGQSFDPGEVWETGEVRIEPESPVRALRTYVP